MVPWYALRPMGGRLSISRTWTSLQYCLEVETRAGAVHVATCPCAMGRGRCIKYSVSESVALQLPRRRPERISTTPDHASEGEAQPRLADAGDLQFVLYYY